VIAALLLACNVGTQALATGERAIDYLPTDGRYSEYAWSSSPTDAPMMMLVDGNNWLLRNGTTWNTSIELGPFAVDSADGLWVDDTLLLPQDVTLGAEQDGMMVTHRGSAEVYYGIFSQTASVEVAEGDFAGEHTLAIGHGPIVFTWQGVRWELVYYEE
jgi:hypothetical protein